MKILSAAALSVLLLASQANASGYTAFNAGIAAYNRNNADETIRLMTLAIAAADLNQQFLPTAYFDRGEMYYRKEMFDLAIADFTECLKRAPGYMAAYQDRGASYSSEKQFDAAAADFAQEIRIRPDLTYGYTSRASVYADEAKPDLAIADMGTAIALEPENADLYVSRADLYRRLSNFDLALSDIGRAVDLDSHESYAYITRGRIYRDQAKFGDALTAFKEALNIAPNNVDAISDIGLTQWCAGNFSEAAGSFETAVKAQPTYSYWSLWLHLARSKAGKPDDDLAARATKLDAAKWPGPIVDFYLGKSTSAQVVTAVHSGSPATVQNRQCEADFYIGEWQLMHNAADAGKSMLQQASSGCPHDFIERMGANSELTRLP